MMEEILAYLRAVADWSPMVKSALKILIILIAASILSRVLKSVIGLLRERVSRDRTDTEEIKRLETLERAFRYMVSVIITLVAGMLVLSELGINIAPILGAAGVAGIAVGFGAQSLIKDYFNGFFMLLENQIRKGDVVMVGGKSGLVEEVTLRHVRLRDYNGDVHFVPSGLIDTVTNKSREYSYALMNIGVAYRESLDEVMDVMTKVAAEMQQDSKFSTSIMEALEIAGVENWADSAVIIRCRLKVQPLEQWNVRRAYLKRLKDAFDIHGIEIPYPHITVYSGQAKDGTAPPFLLRQEDTTTSNTKTGILQEKSG